MTKKQRHVSAAALYQRWEKREVLKGYSSLQRAVCVCVCVCVSSVPYNTGLQVCQLSKHCICKVVQYSSQFYNRSGLKSPRLSAQCRTPAVVCWSCIAQTFKEAKHKSGLFNKREHSIFQLNVQSKEKVTFGDLRSPLLQLVSILCCLM